MIDEVREAKQLFDTLNDTLSASWDVMFSYAEQYYHEHGNLEVPRRYKTTDGYSLGRIERLNQLNMIWKKPDPWEERFRLAEKYYLEHGNLEIPPSYTIDGIWISKWLDEQRQIRNGKRRGKSLTDEQILRLDAIGMRWCKKEELQWNRQYADLQDYLRMHGDIDIPLDYLSANGTRTALWLRAQRKKLKDGKLSKTQVQRLRAVGV